MSRGRFALAVDACVRHPSWPQGEYVTIVEVEGDVFYAVDAEGATDYYFAGDTWEAMPADAERPSDLLEAFAAVKAPTMRQSGMVWAGVRSILDRAS